MRLCALIFVGMVVLVPVSVADAAVFQNPLFSPYIKEILRGFVHAVMYVATPAVIVFIVWTGFTFVAAQGDAKLLGTAKKNAITALIAATLLFSLWAIVQLVGNTLAGLSSAGLLLALGVFIVYARVR